MQFLLSGKCRGSLEFCDGRKMFLLLVQSPDSSAKAAPKGRLYRPHNLTLHGKHSIALESESLSACSSFDAGQSFYAFGHRKFGPSSAWDGSTGHRPRLLKDVPSGATLHVCAPDDADPCRVGLHLVCRRAGERTRDIDVPYHRLRLRIESSAGTEPVPPSVASLAARLLASSPVPWGYFFDVDAGEGQLAAGASQGLSQGAVISQEPPELSESAGNDDAVRRLLSDAMLLHRVLGQLGGNDLMQRSSSDPEFQDALSEQEVGLGHSSIVYPVRSGGVVKRYLFRGAREAVIKPLREMIFLLRCKEVTQVRSGAVESAPQKLLCRSSKLRAGVRPEGLLHRQRFRSRRLSLQPLVPRSGGASPGAPQFPRRLAHRSKNCRSRFARAARAAGNVGTAGERVRASVRPCVGAQVYVCGVCVRWRVHVPSFKASYPNHPHHVVPCPHHLVLCSPCISERNRVYQEPVLIPCQKLLLLKHSTAVERF